MHVSVWIFQQSLINGGQKNQKKQNKNQAPVQLNSSAVRKSKTILAPVPATGKTGRGEFSDWSSHISEDLEWTRSCSISTLLWEALQSFPRTQWETKPLDKVFQSPSITAQEKTYRPSAQRPAWCWATAQTDSPERYQHSKQNSLASLPALVFFTAEHTLDRMVNITFSILTGGSGGGG